MSAPLPPALLSGVMVGSQAFLNWPRAAGADSYNVKRGTVHGGPYVTVGTVTGGSRRTNPPLTLIEFMDSGLVSGTQYYYVVTSVQQGIESGLSPELALMGAAIPSAPGSVSATPGDTQISLSWAAAAQATSYKVWKSTTHGGSYSLLVAQGGTSYVDTGLTNGATYYYVVSAVGSAGEGPMSDEAAGTPSGSIAAMTTANRTSGIAPLGVFFDAVNEATPLPWTSGVAQPGDGDYAKYDYLWDFGDGSSGSWASDGRSKNKAIGYTAAHVYENPGTYTVTLTVLKDDNTILVYTQNIVVSAFAGSTRYISSTGNDSNDGLTTGTPWQSLAKVFANIATNRQFLFKRGDTFVTSTGGFTISTAGPGIFGTYGSGAQPIFQSTNIANGVPLIDLEASDWRFVDINMVGPGANDQVGAISISSTIQIHNTLMYKLTASAWRVPLGNFDQPAIYATPMDGTILAGCSVDIPQVNGVFIGGYHLGIVGNSITNCATSHILRVWLAHKAAISNNFLDNPGADRHCLKMHARPEAGHPPTQYVMITFNKFRRGHAWVCTVAPEDILNAEIVMDVVCDSNDNICNPAGDVQTLFHVIARRVTIRNNWINATFSKYFSVADIDRYSLVPQADDIKVYNNTLYKSDAQSGNQICIVSLDTTDIGSVLVRNNLMSTPADPTSVFVIGTCPGLVQDHNLRSDAPGFADPSTNNFHLTLGSPAVAAGVQEPQVRKDYDGVARPLSAAPDIGAYQLV